MVDFLLGAIVVGLAVRGWWRGLLREAIGLGVLVVGIVAAFRLSTPVGEIFESMAGASPEIGRLTAGVIIFLSVSIGAVIVSSLLHKGLRIVPGLPTVNRAAGAAFGAVAVVGLATLVLSLLAVVPPPDVVQRQIDGSTFAGYLTDPEQVPQKAIGVLSGDRVLERLSNLREAVGAPRLVGDGEVVLFDAVPADDLKVDRRSEDRVLEMLNRRRAGADADPLVMSEPLSELARAHALDVYESGRFGKPSSDSRTFDDRLAAAEIRVVSADQVMAMAVSPEAAQDALFGEEEELAVLTDPDYRRVGIALVKGPLGVILVEVLAA